jgi:hypothetical protein
MQTYKKYPICVCILCMYVCMYVCMYEVCNVCMYYRCLKTVENGSNMYTAYIHTYIYTYINTCMPLLSWRHIETDTHLRMQTYNYVYTYIHTYIHKYTYIYIYIYCVGKGVSEQGYP